MATAHATGQLSYSASGRQEALPNVGISLPSLEELGDNPPLNVRYGSIESGPPPVLLKKTDRRIA